MMLGIDQSVFPLLFLLPLLIFFPHLLLLFLLIFAYRYTISPASFLHWTGFVKNQLPIYMCGPVFEISVLFHWSTCLFWHQNHTLLITIAYNESWGLNFVLFFKSSFGYFRDNAFSGEFQSQPASFCKKVCWDFDWDRCGFIDQRYEFSYPSTEYVFPFV